MSNEFVDRLRAFVALFLLGFLAALVLVSIHAWCAEEEYLRAPAMLVCAGVGLALGFYCQIAFKLRLLDENDKYKLFSRNRFIWIDKRDIGPYLLTIAIGLLPGGLMLYHGARVPSWNEPLPPTANVFLIGIALATVGWIVTVRAVRWNSRKQHTMGILQAVHFNEVSRNHAAKFNARFPPDYRLTRDDAYDLSIADTTPLGEETLPDEGSVKVSLRDAKMSLTYLLNYYELLAMGIRVRDLDTSQVKDFYAGIVRELVRRTDQFILYPRGRDSAAGPFENLVDLYRVWEGVDRTPAQDPRVDEPVSSSHFTQSLR